MFDPTIYENLKVVLEGIVYDLDLAGHIIVTDRKDQIDLANMSRLYSISFSEKAYATGVEAEFDLSATIQDLAAEIVDVDGYQAGCQLEVRFVTNVSDPLTECHKIDDIVEGVWQGRPHSIQQLTFIYEPNRSTPIYENTVILKFDRKINEDQMEDIQELMDCMLQTIRAMNRRKGK